MDTAARTAEADRIRGKETRRPSPSMPGGSYRCDAWNRGVNHMSFSGFAAARNRRR